VASPDALHLDRDLHRGTAIKLPECLKGKPSLSCDFGKEEPVVVWPTAVKTLDSILRKDS